MRRLLLALVFITMTAPVYAERNCTDHFEEGAFYTWDDCTGTYTWASGDVYVGDFKDGDFNGKGKRTWASGNVYEGDWKDDKPSGKGKFSWVSGEFSGDIYEGDWKEGNYQGTGKYSYANGDVYEGEFRDGKKHGQGKYTLANGDVYEGDFKDDIKHGKGKYSWASGAVYEGDLQNGDFHGWGKLTRPDGTTIQEGIWVDDEYSESLTNTKKGKDFRDGNGVLQNYESAKEFFVLAAQGGEQQAMLHLANMYKDQKAIDEPTMSDTIAGWFDDSESKRHLIKAHMWANLAGNKLTQTIEKQLNPEEIKQAQDLAKVCLKNDYQGC